MIKLIFVRHGFSLANKKNLFGGHSDAKLTLTGKKQAKKYANF